GNGALAPVVVVDRADPYAACPGAVEGGQQRATARRVEMRVVDREVERRARAVDEAREPIEDGSHGLAAFGEEEQLGPGDELRSQLPTGQPGDAGGSPGAATSGTVQAIARPSSRATPCHSRGSHPSATAPIVVSWRRCTKAGRCASPRPCTNAPSGS